MKGLLRWLTVLVAERCGWLTFVRADVVRDYLDPESPAGRALENLFRGYDGFYSASPTPITCVEVAFREGFVAVRNSKDPSKVTTYFSSDEWEVFIAGVKSGVFDLPDKLATTSAPPNTRCTSRPPPQSHAAAGER